MLTIRALQAEDIAELVLFTDREIGANYYSPAEWQNIFEKSLLKGKMFSLVLVDGENRVQGIRVSFPPGNWQSGKGEGLATHLWPHGQAETAYFQSIFLRRSVQGQGWGGMLSSASIALLREHGSKGIACHSWQESPHNSSTRYLLKLGFTAIRELPGYWANVPYDCVRCLRPPCQCTAIEMYLDLEKHK